MRNVVTKVISDAKITFFNNKIAECQDQKALYSVINDLLQKNPNTGLPEHDNLSVLVTNFNNFFLDKIEKIRSNLDSCVDETDAQSPVLLPCQSEMHEFQPLTEEQVKKLIQTSSSKSCSLDPIPTWMLKEMLHVLLPVLTLMVNSSLTSSVMPDTFKQSLVKPLLKKPSLPQDELKNYRPVSNLTFMSKIVEKAVRNHLTSYLSYNNLMSSVQSAYRATHSIETALLKVHNDILCAVDRSCGVILVLLDLSAAFDTIDHNVLIRRLSEENGIKGAVLQWIISYFESRYQSVSIKDVVSNPSALCYGVPQGSVLGPEIFSIYTTPIPEIANSHSVQVHQYADDTQLYISYPMDSEEEQFSAVSKIEKCISDIASWMKKNKLKLNEDKTELLIVTPSRQRHKNVITHINVCGCDNALIYCKKSWRYV